MIKVYCRTNLDLFNENWPDELPALPRVGDLIQSKTWHGISNFRLELKVVSVVWTYQQRGDNPPYYVPEIELHDYHKTWSIANFYEWYAPLVGRTVGSFL